jgi:UDP-N-acetylmuramoyl-tripeptide--D-alanyl-D-alanine ligase
MLGQLVDATGARLLAGEIGLPLTGVSTDTRTLAAGQAFFALSGPNFDGNRFAATAVSAGARALLLAQVPADLRLPEGVGLLLHADPRRALGDLGAWYRSGLAATVVGVTGSSGKTTTKNIVHALCAPHVSVVSSPSSFNNDIGVPLTLLSAEQATRVLVVELGTNHPGEIAALCRSARPEVGVITNVGTSHLEGLGSIEGVAQEKGALAEALPREGLCVLAAGGRFRGELARRTSARLLTHSVEGQGASRGDLDARELLFHAGGTTFRLSGLGLERHEVTSPLLGTHNVENLLAALCVVHGLGLPLVDVLPTISDLRPARSRMERLELGGLTLFDDCYNANPQSARAAARCLAGLHGHQRRVLVLGDMLELGERSAELHHELGLELGRTAAASGLDALVLVGTLVKATASGALEAGLPESALTHFDSTEEAASAAGALLRTGDVVLVKGSRGMALERMVAAVKARFAPAAAST